MMLETLVWDAKPRAIPTTPAAPRSGVRLKPSSTMVVTTTVTAPA